MIIITSISLFLASVIMSPLTTEEATKAKVLELATSSLEQHLDMNVYQIEVVARWIPNSLLKAGPENILSVTVSGNIEEHTKFNVLHITRAGRKTSEIQLRLKTEQYVTVAKDRIRSNTPLNIELFEYQWRAVKLGKDRFITNIEELNGKTSKRTLLPGQPIRSNEISSVTLITPGEEVAMIFSKGTIQLGLHCESRQSGGEGEEIQIYCQETRKKYTAKILRAGEVQWLRTH